MDHRGGHRLLHNLAAIAREGDEVAVAGGLELLEARTARELLRLDEIARWSVWNVGPLGDAEGWTPGLVRRNPLTALLAALHPSGYVREDAVTALGKALHGDTHRVALAVVAVRAGDHVREVRERARSVLLSHTTLAELDAAVAPLVAGSDRVHVGGALSAHLAAVRDRHGETALWRHLLDHPERSVRRLSHQRCIELGVLSVDDAVARLRREPDQVVTRLLGEHLIRTAGREVVDTALLHGRRVDGRVLALRALPPGAIDATALRPMLHDPAARVREAAIARWRALGLDAAEPLRHVAVDESRPASERARAWRGLVEAGGADADGLRALLHADEPALRAVGLDLGGWAAQSGDVPRLIRLLTDPTGSVRKRAVAILADRTDLWHATDLAPLVGSDDPRVRHATWRLGHARGGWARVVADLRAAGDVDADLATRGRAAIRMWLGDGAARMYTPPAPRERSDLEHLLATTPLPGLPGAAGQIAFVAGIPVAASAHPRS